VGGVRLGLFLAAFAAWAATAGFAVFTPECTDPLGGDCPSNWASDAATAALWLALALSVVATVVGVGWAAWEFWRGWRERRTRPGRL
jgi:hypothetical protein